MKNQLNGIKTIKDMEEVLKEQGYQFSRQSGSHAVWVKAGQSSAVVPMHGREISRGTARDILKIIFGQNYR